MTRTLLPRTDFDAYIAVDFSANKTPKRGRDSIWWSRAAWSNGRLVVRAARNPRTRDLALTEIRDELLRAVARRESVLVGFDFPYGYPAGFAASLGLPAPAWRNTWELLRELIEDRQDDGWNNRFAVASRINVRLGGAGPFWGCPTSSRLPGLLPRKAAPPRGLREFRHTEAAGRGPKSVWQLFYNGSVGSQALLGLPRLGSLRFDPSLAPASLVWPFETGPRLPPRPRGEGRIVHAEIYPPLVPSLVPIQAAPGRVKDALQVEAQALRFAELDRRRELEALFEVPARLSPAMLADVLSEEGWILGVTGDGRRPPR